MTTQAYLQPDAQELMDQHLFAVERAMSQSRVPGDERRTVIEELRGQILEMVGERNARNAEAMAAILHQLDPPESYADPDNDIAVEYARKATPTVKSAKSRHLTSALTVLALVTATVGVLAFYHYMLVLHMIHIYEGLGTELPTLSLISFQIDHAFWLYFPLTIAPIILFYLPIYFVIAYSKNRIVSAITFTVYLGLILLVMVLLIFSGYMAIFEIPRVVN